MGNFIKDYLTYTENLESPDSFHIWCCISLISTALRRQAWVDMGYFKIFPNMYVVIVSDPGVCRKSAAINAAVALFEDLGDIRMSADATTREALIRALKQCEATTQMDEGEVYIHSSLTIVSKELSVFLGTGNNDLLALLTDLYDCPPKWEYRTKNSGIDTIENVWLSLLGASTPEWLSSSIPISAIGGGFTSRVIFVVESESRKKEPFPELTPAGRAAKERLKTALEEITKMKGAFEITKGGKEVFEEWYRGYSHRDMPDKRFWGYAERKHIHILKLAMVLSVSRAGGMKITADDVVLAKDMLDAIEPGMIEAFGAAGRSTESFDIGVVRDIIKSYGKISKKELLGFIWRDVSPRVFDLIISFLLDGGIVERTFEGGEIYYEWKEGISS